MQKSEELRLLAFCVFWMKRLSGLSLRGSAGAVAISQHQPEHGKAFGESVSACHALSVTFGDSSPRGRANVASLPAMTREGGACKFVTMPLRMGWVSPSCHCILPVAAGSQVCHCEPCGARRGNLAPAEHGKAFGESVSAPLCFSQSPSDSSPRGSYRSLCLAMTRREALANLSLCPSEWGGSPHLVIASFRLQQAPKFVIASLAEQGVAISQYTPGTRESFWRIRKCLSCPLSHLR